MLLEKTRDKMIEYKIRCLRANLAKARKYYKEEYRGSYESTRIKGEQINCQFGANEYIFHTFDTLNIGNPMTLQEDPMIVERKFFRFCDFKNCNIQNTVFRRCCFLGCEFSKVSLFYVNFEDCLFVHPVIEKGCNADDDAYYAPTIFEECKITGEFTNCILDYVVFEKTSIFSSEFKKSSFENALVDRCSVVSAELGDCNLKDFTVDHTDMFTVRFMDEKLTSVNENTHIDSKIRVKKKDKKDMNGVGISDYSKMCLDKSMAIMDFSRLFEMNGYTDMEGEYFYLSKKAELKSLKGFAKIKSALFYVLCGWGERPSFTFFTILISILLFGIVYMFNGIDAAGYIIDYALVEDFSLLGIFSDYGRCLFFSITTFCTVGYGNYVPLGSESMYAAGIQMILGVSLCALWTGCLFRKIAR